MIEAAALQELQGGCHIAGEQLLVVAAKHLSRGTVCVSVQAGWEAAICDKLPVQPLGRPVLPRHGEEGWLHPAGTLLFLINTVHKIHPSI